MCYIGYLYVHGADLQLWLQYEPEIFPGLIYRMKQPKVVLLIFVSGKVVLTGGPSCVLLKLCETHEGI